MIASALMAVTAIYGWHRPWPSDFAQVWFAARAWAHGQDPYAVVGPGRAFPWGFPLLYPMPAVLVALPLAMFPLPVADILMVGIGAFALAWVLMRDRLDDPRLLVFLSGAGALALQTSQWAPLLCAAALLPGWGFLLAAKPTLGLALLAAWPSWRTLAGMAVFSMISLIAWPAWPWEWLAGLPTATHMIAPAMRPGGFLVLLALYRWREPTARLLVAWACLPQTPVFYEVVPLFLIPRTWTEATILTGLTWVVGLAHRALAPYPTYEAMMGMRGDLMLWGLYLPCVALVLGHASGSSASPDPPR